MQTSLAFCVESSNGAVVLLPPTGGEA